MEQAGYSGTPLAKKLGIKEGFSIILYNQPEYYFKLFTDMPKNLEQLEKDQLQDVDFIHLFCTRFEELKTVSERYKPRLKPNGLLWISWPKGTSGIKTDLKRDTIREYMLFIGLVDVKVAAIDNEWSGLKFVYRLKDRTQ